MAEAQLKKLSITRIELKSKVSIQRMMAKEKPTETYGVWNRSEVLAKTLGTSPASAIPHSCHESSNISATYIPKLPTKEATTTQTASHQPT